MNHKGTKDTKEEANRLSSLIIGAALEVHRSVGPGLLESVYEECLAHELSLRHLTFKRQLGVPLHYKGIRLDVGYRLDLLVEGVVIVEIKAVEQLLKIHEAQLLTYLRATSLWLGLLLNFHVPKLQQGIRRLVQ
jgi:GxxExxY protein